MEGMPSALPDGEPVPDDGALPAHALAGAGRAAPRVLPARPVLRDPLRLLRLQHLHRDRAARHRRRPRLPRQLRGHPRRRDPPRPQGARRRPARRSRTVFVGGGTPTLLAADDLVRMLGGDPGRSSASRTTRRSPPRRIRSRSTRPYLADAARGRLQPDLLRHAERPAARPEGPGPYAHAGPARGVRRGGAGGGLRARQPRPDLRHARGDRRRLAGLAGRRRSAPGRTTSRRTR